MSSVPEPALDNSPRNVIEVTDAMIEAGRTVILDEISVWFGSDYDSAEMAEKVFRAMIRTCRLL
jgi:hypothetical protein